MESEGIINSSSISFSYSKIRDFDNDMNVVTPKKRKIIILGPPSVGKSAIITRFKDNIFFDYYEPTIQTTTKKGVVFKNEPMELEIIDIDGQTEYTIFSYSRFSYGIHGYIFVYSIDNRNSFETVKIIHSKLLGILSKTTPQILVGNKCDLINNRKISYEEGKNLANEFNCAFIECSAKTNFNIQKLFYSILVEINKFESNIDIESIYCNRIVKYITKNVDFMTYILYIFIIFNFVRILFNFIRYFKFCFYSILSIL